MHTVCGGGVYEIYMFCLIFKPKLQQRSIRGVTNMLSMFTWVIWGYTGDTFLSYSGYHLGEYHIHYQ